MTNKLKKNLSHTDICLLLDFYGGLLTKRQRELMALYYNDDFSLSEIAEIDKTSRQSVHTVIRRAVARLSMIESSLLLLEQQNELNQLIDQMRKTLKDGNSSATLLLLDRLDRCLNRSAEGDS